jgi:hypothetical protein
MTSGKNLARAAWAAATTSPKQRFGRYLDRSTAPAPRSFRFECRRIDLLRGCFAFAQCLDLCLGKPRLDPCIVGMLGGFGWIRKVLFETVFASL